MHWFKLQIICPRCKSDALLREFWYASDGETRLKSICPKCRTVYTNVFVENHFADQARRADHVLSPQDKEMLHKDFHIKWEDDATGIKGTD
jgi:phage FluMu protein Com